MDIKRLGGLIVGVILLILAAYFFVAMDNFWLQYVAAVLSGLVGIVLVIFGVLGLIRGGTAAPATMEAPMASPEPSAPAAEPVQPEAPAEAPAEEPTEQPPAAPPMQ